jgi:hypothetical protein
MPSLRELESDTLKTETAYDDHRSHNRIQYKFKSIDRQIDRQLNNLSSQLSTNHDLAHNLREILSTRVDQSEILPQINISGQVMKQQKYNHRGFKRHEYED